MEYEEDEFSMSSYDGEQGDSLVIKPPQAVVLRKEKREKRRERHRHKTDRHKEHHKTRDHRVHYDRREHRRHRERDGNRREIRKRRERMGKHDMEDLRNKFEKEQFDDSMMIERLFQKRYRERDELYIEEREFDRGRDHGGHRERHKEQNLDPSASLMSQERFERVLQADMQKELSQKEADSRRQKREEDKREEKMIEELRRKAQASMMRRSRQNSRSKEGRIKRRKYGIALEEPEVMEISADDEQHTQSAPEEEHEHTEKVSDEELSNASSSEESENNAESDSRTSSEEDVTDKDSVEEISDRKSRSRSESMTPSGSSSDSTEGEEEEEDKESKEVEVAAQTSPKPATEAKLPVYYPAIMGCRSVDEFECLNRIEEGTYGVVYRAREKNTDQIVALKRLKMEKEKEGFPITSLREINTLLKGQHENIVTVREIVVGSNMDKIYIVMDYVEHDLKSLMETMRQKKQSFAIGEVKTLMIQLLRAVHHLHDNWILHRDLKTSNLLLSHRGILKVGDFGLAREYGSPLKQYTPIVVTLWYRAPELLLGTKLYSCPIDAWSVGCIFGELLGMESMFPGKSEIDQLNKIFKDLGTPSEKIWPGYNQLPVVKKTTFADFQYNHLRERYKTRLSDEGFTLLNKFLTYNPAKRITCVDAMKHDYFLVELPAPIDPAMFPTWPAKSENPHGRTKKSSPKPPSGGKNFKDLGDGEDESIAGFFLGGEAPRGPGFTLKF